MKKFELLLMNIRCPNCETEYRVKLFAPNLSGQNVKCAICYQEWFQYKIFWMPIDSHSKEFNLKEMALEEYFFEPDEKKLNNVNKTTTHSNTDNHSPSKSKDFSELDELRERLKESSELLKDATDELSKTANEKTKDQSRQDWSTVVGFISISLIAVSTISLHTYNERLVELFPKADKILTNYYSISNILIAELIKYF